MKEKEKNVTESVVLKDVLLEYDEVIKAAKDKLAENNSKELNSLIEKFLKESDNKNEPFNKAGKEVQESATIQKPIGEVVKEGFETAPAAINMKEASLSEVEAAFDNANSEDEFQVVRSDDQQGLPSDDNNFDLTSIESEIDEMMQQVNQAEQMQQQAQQSTAAPSPVASATVAAPLQNDPMAKMKEMYEGMGKFLKEMEAMSSNQAMMNEFHSKMSEMYGESYKAQMDEAKLGELFSMYKKVKSGNAGEPVNSMNETAPVAEVAVAETTAPAVEEGHGVSLSHNKHAGEEQQPRIENGKEYAAHRIRVALQKESIEKKMSALLKENMNLTKQLNKTKTELTESKGKATQVESIKKLNEDYKAALEKYRGQLKEMAVLNTNISYVNNLLVNEGLALSMKDKEEIIEKFKKIGNIVESENTYKKLLQDLSQSKKSIKESVEDKVANIVESSSAKKLEESVNASTPETEHINKILKYSGIK